MTGRYGSEDTGRASAVSAAALAEIDPDKLDMLADWLDLDDARKSRSGPPEVQADLRRWAQLVREEQLWNLSPDARPQAARPELAPAGPHITMCANCDLPVTNWGRHAKTSTGWTHWGFWQGVRCAGTLLGAQPGREITWDEYQDWLSGRILAREAIVSRLLGLFDKPDSRGMRFAVVTSGTLERILAEPATPGPHANAERLADSGTADRMPEAGERRG